MNNTARFCTTISLLTALAVAPAAHAAPAPGDRNAPRDAPQGDAASDAPFVGAKLEPVKRRPLGLSLELGLASGFLFRGYNVFQSSGQLDPTLTIQPEIDWVIGETGITVGYWGLYQLTGDDVETHIDGGSGAEQGLYVHYARPLTGALTLSAWLSWYFYPGATEEAAGAVFPCYLEPGAGIHLRTLVGLGMDLSFLGGLQSGISQYSYLYLNPYVDHTFELLDTLWIEARLGFGYKLFTEDPSVVADNMFDVTAAATLTWVIGGRFYAKGRFGATWTSIEEREETDDQGLTTTVDPGFTDEVAFFGGVGAGVEF